LSGTIPAEWSSLTNLKALNLGHNKGLSGEIPAFLGKEVTELDFLDLQSTGLNGKIPIALEHLTAMSTFPTRVLFFFSVCFGTLLGEHSHLFRAVRSPFLSC